MRGLYGNFDHRILRSSAVDATGLRGVGIEISSRTQGRLEGVVFVSNGVRVTIDGQSRSIADAWQMLSLLDTNRDGKLDNRDLSWRHVRIFHDRNADGSMSPDELLTIAEAGIRDIAARATGPREGRTDAHGNTLVEGTFTASDGALRRVADVAFARVSSRNSGVALR